MPDRLKRLLPFVAVIGAVLFAITVVQEAAFRPAFLADTGNARPAVEAALAGVQAMRPASIDDPTFRQAVRALKASRYIGNVILFHPDGEVAEIAGMFGKVGMTARQWASLDLQGALDAVPKAELSDLQREMLLAASYIRAEGTHNDIYRHLLVPVRDANGAVLAMVGVAYDIFTDTGRFTVPEIVLGISMRLGGLLLYWLSLPLWVLLDARSRGERAWAWAAFVLVGNLVALLAYLLAHRPARANRPLAQTAVRRGH